MKVNEVYGVAGFLQPGSFVDLLVNLRDKRDNPMSKIVLERVLVLAVAQNTDRPEEGKARVVNAVTLEVSPEEAEKIDLARSIGTLSLVLRNQVDMKAGATDGAERKDLFVSTACGSAGLGARCRQGPASVARQRHGLRRQGGPAPRSK